MKVVDQGHLYELNVLDGEGPAPTARLRFVKREGPNYPGNVGAYPGVTTQEVIRALIDRMLYVNGQQECIDNRSAISHLRDALVVLEIRAARTAGYALDLSEYHALGHRIEAFPTCERCGHLACRRPQCQVT